MGQRTHRLFCAVFPPPDTADALAASLVGLPLQTHRAVPRTQIHLTVLFIGDTPGSRLAEAAESVRRAAVSVEAFSLVPRRILTLPERGPARLVAVETDAPSALVEFHRRVVSRLARRPRENSREFFPHLTLCRFCGAGSNAVRLDVPCAVAGFPVGSVKLVESVLHPDGAEYRVLSETQLGTRE